MSQPSKGAEGRAFPGYGSVSQHESLDDGVEVRLPQAAVYLADPARQDDEDMLVAHAALDAGERGRARELWFEQDRRAFVVAHGLTRQVLALHLRSKAERLVFRRTPAGRPELALSEQRWVRFNLSHTRTMIGCAVAPHVEVGFDVETVSKSAPLELAESYFSTDEVRALRALSVQARVERFYLLWALKEACLKARGVGLAGGLNGFTVEPRTDGAAVLVAPEGSSAWSGSWQIQWWRLPEHVAAVALRTPRAMPVSLFTQQRVARLSEQVAAGCPARVAFDHEPRTAGGGDSGLPAPGAEAFQRRHDDC
ncbi:MAG TPA: 4'-phosphopantetheinyl transferase superfamily protein [Polyangiaceae bacterium]|nr:4'-phosphopantetheinyl transferase superfamily protein [Polyangiaceae bacterium]